MSSFVSTYQDIHDHFLKQVFIYGHRGVGMSTALREWIHICHEGHVLVAFPDYGIGQWWQRQYRDEYSTDWCPQIVTRIDHIRGQRLPLYADCWDQFDDRFKEELQWYGIVNAVSTY